MSDEKQLTITLEQKDNYEFMVRFAEGQELLMDEPEPLGGNAGPSASKVLSAAVGNCLSASLMFCLQKSRVEFKTVKTTVNTTITRGEKGRLRITGSRVKIYMDFGGEPPERMKRCLELFENFCVVTASVRSGIPVEVEVEDQRGQQLYLSKH